MDLSAVIGHETTKYNILEEAIIIIKIDRDGFHTDESRQTFGNRQITVENLTPIGKNNSADKIRSELYEIFSKYSEDNKVK